MGIRDRFLSLFIKPKKQEDGSLGKVILKPSEAEKGIGEAIASRGGTAEVPETKKTFTPSKSSGGSGGKSSGVELGVPFIKPEEREKGAVGFVPQGKTISENIDTPPPTMIQTSPSTTFSRAFGRTKEDIVFTQRNIYEAEAQQRELTNLKREFGANPESFIGRKGVEVRSTPEGEEITLTEDFVKGRIESGRGDSLGLAREFFADLPESKKRGAYTSSTLTGVAGLGVGVVEFTGGLIGSLGQRKISSGEDVKLIDFKPADLTDYGNVPFVGGALEDLGKTTKQPGLPTSVGFFESPTQYIKEKSGSPQFDINVGGTTALILGGGVGAIKNIKRVGAKEGTLETLGMFSPLRPKPGVYGYTAEEIPFDLTSVKKTKGGTTTRVIAGGGLDEPFTIVSVQQTGKSGAGRASSFITGEGTLIKPSGLMTEGTITSASESILLGKGGKVRLEKGGISADINAKGGISNALTQQRYSVFEGGDIVLANIPKPSKKFLVNRGGGVLLEGEGALSPFTFGKRKPVYKTEIFEPKINLDTGKVNADFIRSNLGRYKVKSDIKGVEVDLNKLDFGFVKEGKGFSPGKTKTPLETTFTRQELSSGLGALKSSTKVTTTPKITTQTNIRPVILEVPPQIKTTQELLSLTETKPSPKDFEKIDISGGQIPFIGSKPKTKSKTKSRGAFSPKQTNILGTSLLEEQRISQKVKQKQEQKLIQKQTFDFPTFTGFDVPKFPRMKIPRGFIVPPPIILPPIGFGSTGKRKTPKRKYKRTPSFAAGVLGITAPKIDTFRETSGIFERPLIKPKKRKRTKSRRRKK